MADSIYCAQRTYRRPHTAPVRPGYFQPRRNRAGTIYIRHITGDVDQKPLQTQLRKPRATAKLAGSREHAKRLLRSVIANPSSPPRPSHPSDTTEVSDPTRRRGSVLEVGRLSNGAVAEQRTREGMRGSVSGPVSGLVHRPGLTENIRTASDASGRFVAGANTSNIPGVDAAQKPVASGNGVSATINLAEPVLFVQGFEQMDSQTGNTAMLRGTLHLRVTKSAKIKAVTLKFKGRAITKWPEGIPPRKIDFEEVDNIMSHTWPFFNAQFPTAEGGSCADHVEMFKPPGTSANPYGLGKSPNSSSTNLSSKDARKLSLQVNQSRSFNKGESSTGGPSVAAKGYRTFHPGDYVYNFELPIDHRLPETIDVELGQVKYELEALVERAGAFKTNLVGTKEITLIRAPAEGSLEQVEPIAISRNWEDQLHYDIVISGKSFPLGTQVPIAFKLTPLAKVQCHRIKVLVTENIEYFCSGKRVHRMEPTRKVQLFEKRSDAAPVSTFPGSTMRVTAGGGVPYDARARAANGEQVATQDSANLLGDLQGESNIGPTEMEFNVQLPSCSAMRERERAHRLHFDTTYQNIQVHHWIKIVMRLSKPDANDPSKRRHFEISIDSPFHILSCRATQANTSLPAYTSPESAPQGHLAECGCPGAPMRRNSPPSFVPTLSSFNGTRPTSSHAQDAQRQRQQSVTAFEPPMLARPQVAHINTNGPQRPMHMLRVPSFNPPAFDDEQPPPALVTPPPQYDSIASPTSGLSDYFARLSDAYDEDSDDERSGGRGRVEVPLTPGARATRSMDVGRTWMPIGQYAR